MKLLILTVLLILKVEAAESKYPKYYDAEMCGVSQLNAHLVKFSDVPLEEYDYSDEGDLPWGKKIMGGEDSKMGHHPWAVAIMLDKGAVCSGSLISKKHVLTAAHCFGIQVACKARQKELILNSTEILIGGICKKEGPNCPQEFLNESFKPKDVHGFQRFFDSDCVDNDYAIIELEKEVKWDITHVCLPDLVDMGGLLYKDDKTFTVFGYGTNGEQKDGDLNRLQTLDFIGLVPSEECKANEDYICARETRKRNVCMGDSGGGLITKDVNGRYTVVGLVSFGSDCGDINGGMSYSYQLYTNVSNHHNDIVKILNNA